MNNMKSKMVVSKFSNFNSEKIVDMSDNNKLKIRVCPKQPDHSSSSTSSLSSPNRLFRDLQSRFLVQNHANFRNSGEPGRLMYYGSDGSWVDYPPEVVDPVRWSFREGKAMVEVSMQGCNCLIDLYRMLEVRFDTGHEKSIAWIDVNGKCFFPKVFVNSAEGFVGFDKNDSFVGGLGDQCPKIAIEVKVIGVSDNLENKSKRKRESEEIEVDQVVKGKSEACSSNVKNFRANRHQDEVNGGEMGLPRWSGTRFLRKEDKEFGIVKGLLLSGLGRVEPGAVITSIHKCTRSGVMEKARYGVFVNHMEAVKKTRGDSNTVFAWYGTSAMGVQRILAHGFGLPDEVIRSRPLGVGVYLSPVKSPHSSVMLSEMDDNGEKHVILCRVILGKCEKVTNANQKVPSSVDFDSGVDDLMNPGWYVVWQTTMNTHILPEVVVSYKCANNIQGPVTGIPSVKLVPPASSITVPELVFKLGKSLSPPKFEELQTLLGTWKDVKVSKDKFMQQLRSIVGDEKLRAVVLEIRG